SEQANRLEEALGGGATLQDAAREVGVPVVKVASLDREGRNASDKPVENLPPAPFLESAFETPDGADSLLLETADNSYFILRVDSVTPPTLRPLETVRAEATADWKSDQRWDEARTKAKKLVERLNNGATIADIAEETGYKVTETQPFTRNGGGAPANTPPTIISELFAAKSIGRAAMGNGTSGIDVAQLTQIDKAAPTQDKEGVEALTESLRLGIANDIAAQLDSALRKRHNVSVNPGVVQHYFYQDEGES
ncbi:MAG: peptidyl-prolyl cis-trans isomerase, partial [Alphaproteobacteria bacterium]|nr:peptidyl-prolyl cis-trans isomerase [Alphaproteobacteria bacterium]